MPSKYYVVKRGRQPGIYDTWVACKEMVDGFEGAVYKSFVSKEEAHSWFGGPMPDTKHKGVGFNIPSSGKLPSLGLGIKKVKSTAGIIKESWAVDAACSGNPGKMEYRGVDCSTGVQLFRSPIFAKGTNNVGEFLGIVHALSVMKKQGLTLVLYTDSVTAMGWVKQKKARTKLPRTADTESLWLLIDRAINWLESNTYATKILKWQTEDWGEIPADFGRK